MCSGSNQSQERLLNFGKKPAKQTLIKRGEDETRNWPPVTSFHTKEALRGETQEKPKRTRIVADRQKDRQTDREIGDFVPRFKASTRQH